MRKHLLISMMRNHCIEKSTTEKLEITELIENVKNIILFKSGRSNAIFSKHFNFFVCLKRVPMHSNLYKKTEWNMGVLEK